MDLLKVEPKAYLGTQVDSYVDSQGTMVDDSSQASTESNTSGGVRPALEILKQFFRRST